MRPYNPKTLRVLLALVLDTGNGDTAIRAYEMGIARWGLDPDFQDRRFFGGKLGIDDTETPNMPTAAFNYGERQLSSKSGGNLPAAKAPARVARRRRPRAGGAGRCGRASSPAPNRLPPACSRRVLTQVGPASNLLNVAVGDLFYGTEGWAASDQGPGLQR